MLCRFSRPVRRGDLYAPEKSSMLRPPARFGKCHLPPITAYPWISILASGTASAVMVIRALPGKLSPTEHMAVRIDRSRRWPEFRLGGVRVKRNVARAH